MALISQIYFWNRTLHASDRFSVQRQKSSTVYTATGICHTGSILIPLASSQQNPYDIYLLLCIQYKTPDGGQKTCPKHVEFYSKNKFEKLVPSRWFYYKNILWCTVLFECQIQKSVRQIHTDYYTQVFSYFQISVLFQCLYTCVNHCYLIEQWLVKIPGFQIHSNSMNSDSRL